MKQNSELKRKNNGKLDTAGNSTLSVTDRKADQM